MIALVVAIYCLLLALSIWVILIRPARPWREKVGMLLQILLSMMSAAATMVLDPVKTSFNAFAFLQVFGSLAVGLLSIPVMLFLAGVEGEPRDDHLISQGPPGR